MKFAAGVMIALLAAGSGQQGFGQHRFGGEGMGPRSERLEKFRRMRLVEVLKLNEDDAVRFTAKQRVHDENIQQLLSRRNEAVDQVEAMAEKGVAGKDLDARVADILDVDRKMFDERQRFQNEMHQFLTPEQFARFIVFERNFGRQVRDAIGDMAREKERHMKEKNE